MSVTDQPTRVPATPPPAETAAQNFAKLTEQAMAASKHSADLLRSLGLSAVEQAAEFQKECETLAEHFEARSDRMVEDLTRLSTEIYNQTGDIRALLERMRHPGLSEEQR